MTHPTPAEALALARLKEERRAAYQRRQEGRDRPLDRMAPEALDALHTPQEEPRGPLAQAWHRLTFG